MLRGLLIDRYQKQVEIYRQGKDIEILNAPINVSEEIILPRFVLDLQSIW